MIHLGWQDQLVLFHRFRWMVVLMRSLWKLSSAIYFEVSGFYEVWQ